MHQFDLGSLVLRIVFGLFFAYHGYNKFFGPSGLQGTAGWFASIGMRWPAWQARLAATTEVGSGLMLAVGLLTPFASAGVIGVMTVAIVVSHAKVGFFIFKPGQGWEYCASIAVAAWVIATVGPGEWPVDHALHIEWNGWVNSIIAAVLGTGGALSQLIISFRPPGADPLTAKDAA